MSNMNHISKDNQYKSISVNSLDDNLSEINLIDVRDEADYKEGHVPTAKNIPMNNIILEPEKYLDKSKEYYIICQAGKKSTKTCESLWKKGYKVVNIKDGIDAYNKVLEV